MGRPAAGVPSGWLVGFEETARSRNEVLSDLLGPYFQLHFGTRNSLPEGESWSEGGLALDLV